MKTCPKTPKVLLIAKVATLMAVVGAAMGFTLLAGCATLHPVPAGDQPLAEATVAGVVVSVPRLDSGDYPSDVLDVANAVLVVIENQSQQEILIDPEGFLLGGEGGMQLAPIAPQELALKAQPAPAAPQDTSRAMLAWRGGGGFRMSAPRGSSGVRLGGGGPVRVAPAWRGGYAGPHRSYGYRGGFSSGYRSGFYTPRSHYYGQRRWGFWGRGPLYWGPNFSVGWYGSPLFWPWFYEGPRAYAWSREDALRLGLPAGRLPPGGRTGGFLYFPHIERTEGMPLTLQWTIREANTLQPMGTVQLPLEMRAD